MIAMTNHANKIEQGPPCFWHLLHQHPTPMRALHLPHRIEAGEQDQDSRNGLSLEPTEPHEVSTTASLIKRGSEPTPMRFLFSDQVQISRHPICSVKDPHLNLQADPRFKSLSLIAITSPYNLIMSNLGLDMLKSYYRWLHASKGSTYHFMDFALIEYQTGQVLEYWGWVRIVVAAGDPSCQNFIWTFFILYQPSSRKTTQGQLRENRNVESLPCLDFSFGTHEWFN